MLKTKAQLREQIRLLREKLSLAQTQSAAQRIAARGLALPLFKESAAIAAYVSIKNEINPMPLIEYAAKTGKNCYLPIARKDNLLHFLRYTPGDPLVSNRYGIPEPLLHPKKMLSPTALDVVFVPLLAFDLQGYRLGMGAGFYDRTFAFLHTLPRAPKPKLIGLAYEFQKQAKIPTEPWDIPLDGIITEENLYWHNPSCESQE